MTGRSGGRRLGRPARWIATLSAFTLAAVAGMTFGFAGPASAVESQCPSNWFCVWSDADYQGHFARFQVGASKLNENAIGGYIFGDEISSVSNKTSAAWCLYRDQHYEGAVRSISRYALSGYHDNWLGDNGFSDNVSSLRPCPA
jgi:hypothetical protein